MVNNKELPSSVSKLLSKLEEDALVVVNKIVESEMDKLPTKLTPMKAKKSSSQNVVQLIKDFSAFIDRLEKYGKNAREVTGPIVGDLLSRLFEWLDQRVETKTEVDERRVLVAKLGQLFYSGNFLCTPKLIFLQKTISTCWRFSTRKQIKSTTCKHRSN